MQKWVEWQEVCRPFAKLPDHERVLGKALQRAGSVELSASFAVTDRPTGGLKRAVVEKFLGIALRRLRHRAAQFVALADSAAELEECRTWGRLHAIATARGIDHGSIWRELLRLPDFAPGTNGDSGTRIPAGAVAKIVARLLHEFPVETARAWLTHLDALAKADPSLFQTTAA